MTDRLVIRMVVVILGVVAIGGLGLVGALSYAGRPIPDALIAITSAALSAVAALLSRTGSEPAGPQQVIVANPPQAPAQVEQVP